MKKVLFSFAILAVAAVMVSCGNKSGQAAESQEATAAEDSPAMQLLNSVPFTEEGLTSMIKTPKDEALTDVEYEALWLAYSKVNLNEEKLELENSDALKAIHTLLREHKRPANASAIQESLLTNSSPQVRGLAMGQFTSLFGVKKDNIQKLLTVLEKEENPYVLQQGVRALSNELKTDGVAKFVFAQAKNENPKVRRVAAWAIGNSWSQGVPGINDEANALLADKDEEVRRAMLGCVGKLNDESFIPELVKVLNDDQQYKLHPEAMRSLYTLWYDYPFHKNTSKAAYEATINYLKKKPRTENIPAWSSIGELRSKAESNYPAWQAKATYYNNAEYIKLMSDIATDVNANWLGRSAAIDVIATIGTKADLERVQAAVKSNSADQKQNLVLQAIERKLK